MSRVIAFAIGFLTFLAAHQIEVFRWTTWFRGRHEPWFLNAGPSIVFTMGCVFGAGLAVALCDRSSRPARGITLACGAMAAMTAVLFLKEGGPGTIFPIVMAFGGFVLLASSIAGAWLGREIRGAVKRT